MCVEAICLVSPIWASAARLGTVMRSGASLRGVAENQELGKGVTQQRGQVLAKYIYRGLLAWLLLATVLIHLAAALSPSRVSTPAEGK